MRRETIISKGYYTYPQTSGLIAVRQYIVLLRNNEKQLLLRLTNERGEAVTGYTLRVLQYNAAGALVGTQTVEESGVSYKPKATFGMSREIPLSEDCVDFRVTVLSVACGSYVHTLKGEEIVSTYVPTDETEAPFDEARALRRMKGERYKVSSRTYRPKKAMFLICAAIILLVAIASAVQLSIFMSTETLFTLDHVSYRFETDNHEDGPICMVGYTGSARNLIIPEEIEGHKIARIASNAFKDSKLRSVVIEGETVIEDNAFKDCHSLESVSMERVPHIGSFAFSNCERLDRLSIGALGAEVENFAFSQCTSLNEVTLPSSLRLLGNGAFSGCSSLRSITLPVQIDEMGEGIVSDCVALEYLEIPFLTSNAKEEGALAYYFSLGGSIHPPKGALDVVLTDVSEVESHAFEGCDYLKSVTFLKPVSHIGTSAFSECQNLLHVQMPDGLTKLGARAFYRCTSLEEIDLGSRLEEISSYAFSGCRRLKRVNLPQTLKAVQEGAFQNCSSLLTLTLPWSVDYLGNQVLDGCSSLETLTLPFLGYSEGDPTPLEHILRGSRNSLKNLTILRGDRLVSHAMRGFSSLQTVTLPPELAVIESYAFLDCHQLEKVNVQGALNTVESFAFQNCYRLQDMTLSDSLTYLGEGVFYDCSSLSAVSMPQSLQTIPNSLFYGCSSLVSVNIPDGVETIQSQAFANCSSLTQMDLPAKLTAIEPEAFRGCSSLKSIAIPSNITRIEAYVFAECSDLSQVTFPQNLQIICVEAFMGCDSLQTVELPASLQSLESAAFSESGLTSVTIPEDIDYIGNGVFFNCNSLGSLTVPFLGENAYQNAILGYFFSNGYSSNNYVPSALKSVTVLGGTSMTKGAFQGCRWLTSVSLSPDLNLIPSSAFSGCTALKTLTIPQTVTAIESSAFSNCQSLSEITLPTSLQIIEASAFNKCTSLNSITVPNSVQSIGSGAFQECSGLTEITLPFVGTDRNSNGTFKAIFSTVPKNLKSVTLTDCTRIPANAFSNCSALTSVVLPEGLTSIDSQAFSGCSALTSVVLPEGLTSIGSQAFSGCSALSSIVLPEGLLTIAARAFQNCSALESMTVPETVTSMGNYLFEGCNAMRELSIPFVPEARSDNSIYTMFYTSYHPSLEKISLTNTNRVPDYAFRYCYELKEILLCDEITSIGTGAFQCCERLSTLTLPESLNYVGDYAFEGCYRLYVVRNNSNYQFDQTGWDDTYLTSVALTIVERGAEPITVTKNGFEFLLGDNGNWYCIGYEGTATDLNFPSNFNYGGTRINQYQIPQYAFENNETITSVDLTVVTHIGAYAFRNCYNMKTVTLHPSLQSIDYDAFWECRNLREVYNYSTLNIEAGSYDHGSVAYYAYVVHTSEAEEPLTEVKINGLIFQKSDDRWFLTGYEGNAKSLTLGSLTYNGQRITSYRIMKEAFMNNGTLTSVTIGNAVTEIGQQAFAYCSSLKSVSFANNKQITNLPFGVFEGCDELTNVILPSTLTRIENFVFNNCSKLTKITIPKSVEYLGSYAFQNCYALKTVTFEEGSVLQSIDYGAFSNCEQLESIMIPKNVTYLGSEAFRNCYALKTVTFTGGALENIDGYAFYNCYALEEMILPEGLMTIGTEAFANCSALQYVRVPQSLSEIYNNAFLNDTSILEVVNLSNLPITAGKTTYGRIAQYALVVHSSEADRLPTKKVTDENSTYWFAYYNNSWCLYSIDTTLERYSNTIMMLPTLTENGTELTYRILRNALKSAPQYLMIPDCVLSIDSDSQNRLSANSVTVYYEGTEQEWNKLMSEGYGVDVRFYTDCVHRDGEWTYVNGSVSTVIPTITQQVKKKATCVEEGIMLHECSRCKETWETVIGLTDHTFDENYACTVCDKAAIKVTLNTIGTLSGFENDSTNPFTIDQEGVIQTGSVAQSYSQMILTADRTMRIIFDYRIENGKSTDRWYIYLNNKTQETMPGTEIASRHFEIVLNEGDVLRIRFRNSGGTSSITGIGFIENFYIL